MHAAKGRGAPSIRDDRDGPTRRDARDRQRDRLSRRRAFEQRRRFFLVCFVLGVVQQQRRVFRERRRDRAVHLHFGVVTQLLLTLFVCGPPAFDDDVRVF